MTRGRARASLPPGFRFHPTDVELIMYYLKRRILGKRLRFEALAELDLYKFTPWDLPEKSLLRSNDLEWYFFCPRDKKYANGSRTNRATKVGYWKTTGRDRPICNKSRTIGMKKTLIFHVGRAPRGDRTNWVMHEYRIEDKDLVDAGISQDSYVICKIFEKSGAGPKNGEQHGAPFEEEEWDDDDDDDVNSFFDCFPLGNIGFSSVGLPDGGVSVVQQSTDNKILENVCGSLEPIPCQNTIPETSIDHPSVEEGDDIESLLAILGDGNGDGDAFCVNGYSNSEITGLCNPGSYVHSPAAYDIFNGLEDLSTKPGLKTTDNFTLSDLGGDYVLDPTLSNSLGDGYLLDHTLIGDESYLELDDLQHPMNFHEDANGSEHISYDLWEHSAVDGNFAPFPNANEFGGTAITQANPLSLSSGQAMGESPHTPQILARGKQHRGFSYSRLQCLLDSIPTRPAFAAELVQTWTESKGSNNSSLFAYDVKAEVTTFRCECTKDALSGKQEEFSCLCCYRHNLRRKEVGGHGFTFLFTLGLIIVLLWVFLLAIAARLGSYAWRLTLI
ncbi:hypothetical protein GIB67_029819 [Kingdonia uniflora]|uniref:NAC domain-containing protein n=1 Tax=Kingdonia uniflora TaxID=39325 RepID=A0A7J7NIV1_9MAGN|nr:hypothetical protein GIB67_029819 [Kingdonia uniflora]